MCPPDSDGSTERRAGDHAAPPFPWDSGAYDAHCHPTDTMASTELIPSMRTRSLTIMATRTQDQGLVDALAARHGTKVVPAFGWHPWFSYQLYDDTTPPPVAERTYDPSAAAVSDAAARARSGVTLAAVLSAPDRVDDAMVSAAPPLRSLSAFIAETRERLLAHPSALVGEVGLDKAFRLPQLGASTGFPTAAGEGIATPGGREGRLLSPHRVHVAHQVAIMRAQLALAAELGRAVSVHGVQAHGLLFDTLATFWKGHEREIQSRRERRMAAPGAEEDVGSSSESGGGDDDGDEQRPGERQAVETRPPGARPYPPRICLHSFSGPPEVLRQYLDPRIPARIFFSFSTVVNYTSAG